MPQVPWPNRPTVFALKTIGSMFLSAQALVGHTAPRCSHQPFWSDVARSHSGWGYAPAPLSGQEGEGPLQENVNFPNRLSFWERLGADLSLGYELTVLSVCSTKTSVLSIVFVLGAISSTHPSLCSLFHTSFRCSPSPSGEIWPRDSLHTSPEQRVCHSSFCLCMGKPNSSASKTYLRIQIRHIHTSLSPLIRVYP